MSIGKQSLTGLCAWLLLALTLNTWAQAPTLEPPRVQLVDRNHVKTVGPVARISRTPKVYRHRIRTKVLGSAVFRRKD